MSIPFHAVWCVKESEGLWFDV